MSELTLPKKVKISDNVLFQEIDNEYVLLNMESEQYFGLDEIGAKVWHIISEDGNTERVLNQIMGEYNVSIEELTSDISRLLHELNNEHLITIEA